jgi:hypothetical protein
LEQVPDAMDYLEAGHARGKVVIAVADGGRAVAITAVSRWPRNSLI